jgi:hypothetical protein
MSNLDKYINLLEKLTNKKVRLIEDESSDNNILIPRRSSEERQKNYLIAINKKIQEYIKNGSKGDLDLNGSPIEILPDNLIEVDGDLNLYNCKNLKSLNNLKYVKGELDLFDCINLENTNNLERVSKSLILYNCKNLKSLNNLRYVGGSLYLSNCINLKELPNNLKIEGSLGLDNTSIEKLPSGLKVGDDNIIYLRNTPLAKNKELLNQYRKKFKIVI